MRAARVLIVSGCGDSDALNCHISTCLRASMSWSASRTSVSFRDREEGPHKRSTSTSKVALGHCVARKRETLHVWLTYHGGCGDMDKVSYLHSGDCDRNELFRSRCECQYKLSPAMDCGLTALPAVAGPRMGVSSWQRGRHAVIEAKYSTETWLDL